MNILKNVINKLSQEEKKEVNLASEKVELARKAPSVQKDLQNLDAKLKKAESLNVKILSEDEFEEMLKN